MPWLVPRMIAPFLSGRPSSCAPGDSGSQRLGDRCPRPALVDGLHLRDFKREISLLDREPPARASPPGRASLARSRHADPLEHLVREITFVLGVGYLRCFGSGPAETVRLIAERYGSEIPARRFVAITTPLRTRLYL